VLLCSLRLRITNSRAEKNPGSRSYYPGILKGDIREVEIDVYSGRYRQHLIFLSMDMAPSESCIVRESGGQCVSLY
jgi:hypothetical protein